MKEWKYSFLIKPVFFIISLIAGTILILKVEKIRPSDMGEYQDLFSKDIKIKRSESYPLSNSRQLTKDDRKYGLVAWNYFRRNTHPVTGFPKASSEVEAFSMNDLGAYLFAIASAYETGIIDSVAFTHRINLLSGSLSKLPLLDIGLPNRYYTLEGKMIDEKGEQIDNGIGWSALEISRVIAFSNMLRIKYPYLSGRFNIAIKRWNINELINEGYLYAGVRKGKIFEKIQEGTLGREEYSAKAFVMAGYDATEALSYTDFIRFKPVYDTELAIDARGSEDNMLSSYINCTPFILDGIEYGWDVNSKELAYRLYKIHKNHYGKTNAPVAMGDSYLKASLSSITNCVYSNGSTFCTINSDGSQTDNTSFINTEIAFAWNILYNDIYAKVLWSKVRTLYDDGGWYSGVNTNNGNVNKLYTSQTNAMVLESLAYKMKGNLIRH